MAIGLLTENEMNRAMLYENINGFDKWTVKKRFKVGVDLLITRELVAVQYRDKLMLYLGRSMVGGDTDEAVNVFEVGDCGI